MTKAVRVLRWLPLALLLSACNSTTDNAAPQPGPTPPPAAPGLAMRVNRIEAFLDTCPANDPHFKEFSSKFEILVDKVKIDPAALPCTEPTSQMPTSAMSSALTVLQAVRLAYSMDPGRGEYLPWTNLTLSQWLTSRVSGINLVTNGQSFSCCARIDGKLYITQPNLSPEDLQKYQVKLDAENVTGQLGLLVHEARHADPDEPGHVSCSNAANPGQPSPKEGCDAAYDLNNLGGYGVRVWLWHAWATGHFNMGISCGPNARRIAEELVGTFNANNHPFVAQAPQDLPPPQAPYGGPCL